MISLAVPVAEGRTQPSAYKWEKDRERKKKVRVGEWKGETVYSGRKRREEIEEDTEREIARRANSSGGGGSSREL